ncbi:MAG: molybdopterin-synthase adenylyltransferase MoeB [Alphaproteobacteria bacterium]|nr:molybdopterin-synthase adenylyltransferase MoeB [Alphaproteobacteria bacterium]
MVKPFHLSEEQLGRYARHITLDEVGRKGQEQLLKSKVLVIGAGGLGSPVILYLAAAGVGTIGVVDADEVSISNLQRQVLYNSNNIGESKVACAKKIIADTNPDVSIVSYKQLLTSENVKDIVSNYDIIADCTDNFETRFLINDACFFSKKPLVFASISQFQGHLITFKSYEQDLPCYRCLFGAPPPPGSVPSVAEAGVLGVSAGIMGTLQAGEIIKELLNIGDSLAGYLMVYDGLKTSFHKAKSSSDKGCPLCGDHPFITSI